MKTIKKNYIFLTLILISGIIKANTSTYTNLTGYPCVSGITPTNPNESFILSSNGQNYNISPSATAAFYNYNDGNFTNAIITYDSVNNALVLTASTGTNFTNNTPFRIGLSNGSGIQSILDVGQSANFSSFQGAYPYGYNSGNVNSIPSPAYFNIDSHGFINVISATPSLTNNYAQGGTNLNFHDATGTLLTYLNTYYANTSIWIPSSYTVNYAIIACTPVYATATMSAPDVTITVPVSTSASSTLFGTGSITNNMNFSISIIYYGTINGVYQPLNNPIIVLDPQGSFPNITGATKISIWSTESDKLLVNQASIDINKSYDISLEV